MPIVCRLPAGWVGYLSRTVRRCAVISAGHSRTPAGRLPPPDADFSGL